MSRLKHCSCYITVLNGMIAKHNILVRQAVLTCKITHSEIFRNEDKGFEGHLETLPF